MNLPPYLTPDARDLIRKFLKRQVNQRLGAGPTDADSIKTHPYFKVIIDLLYDKFGTSVVILTYNQYP